MKMPTIPAGNPMAAFKLPAPPMSRNVKNAMQMASAFAHHVPAREGLSHGVEMRLRRPKGGHGPHNPGE